MLYADGIQILPCHVGNPFMERYEIYMCWGDKQELLATARFHSVQKIFRQDLHMPRFQTFWTLERTRGRLTMQDVHTFTQLVDEYRLRLN